MPRKPRLHAKSQIYHIIMRGNNQQILFYQDSDYSFFLHRAKKYANELNIEIYGYCLMDNHVHILLGKANPTLSLFVQKLANSYVYYFNHKYERSGHLFQGRFKSEPIENDNYFKTVLRYILQNPEKLNRNFTSYSWSSYKELIVEKNREIITNEYIVDLFGNTNNTISFLSLKEEYKCMDYENKKFIPDQRAITIIQTIFDIQNVFHIPRLNINEIIPKINTLKQIGLSINQIVRLTSLPKKIVRYA